MNISLRFKGKQINLNVRKAGSLSQYIGLMFKGRNTSNLLFDYPDDSRIAIHSWFVFFDFLIVWMDSKNRVMEYKIVRPFRGLIMPKKPCRRFVELPLNQHNRAAVAFFVGK